MLKKIIIGILLISVLGAGGAALAYNANQEDSNSIPTTSETPIISSGNDAPEQDSLLNQSQAAEPQAAIQGKVEEPWQGEGTITKLDAYGFNLQFTDGEVAFIELGPPEYWQSQGVSLAMGDQVSVTGNIQEGMIHAAQVETANGQVLTLRGETGQPMWSGGSTNGNGQNSALSDGDHIPQPMADVDAWLTLEGTLMSFQGGNMTMSTVDGEIIAFQTGQPGFFAEQGVTIQVGDEIVVLGFYEGDQFMAGEITQVSTGLRVMLRDPNGRPLWAGPGNGSTGGNGTQGIGNGTGSQGVEGGSNGAGRGTGAQGSGNGGRGNSGRGNPNS